MSQWSLLVSQWSLQTLFHPRCLESDLEVASVAAHQKKHGKLRPAHRLLGQQKWWHGNHLASWERQRFHHCFDQETHPKSNAILIPWATMSWSRDIIMLWRPSKIRRRKQQQSTHLTYTSKIYYSTSKILKNSTSLKVWKSSAEGTCIHSTQLFVSTWASFHQFFRSINQADFVLRIPQSIQMSQCENQNVNMQACTCAGCPRPSSKNVPLLQEYSQENTVLRIMDNQEGILCLRHILTSDCVQVTASIARSFHC